MITRSPDGHAVADGNPDQAPMSAAAFTPAVHALLADLEAGRLPPEAVAHQALLKELAFDYSVRSLPRIDRLLAGLRTHLQPDYGAFISDPANRGFLRVLAAMVGETTARYIGSRCHWFDAASLRARLQALGVEHPVGDGFGQTLSCEIEGLGLMMPLAAVEAALFADQPPTVVRAADALLERLPDSATLVDPGALPAVSPVLAADAAWRLGQSLGLMACWIVDSIAAGDNPFAPLLLQQRGPEGGVFTSMIDRSFEEAIIEGRQRLAEPDPDVTRAVLAYDGHVRLQTCRTDAIWLEAAVGPEGSPGPRMRARLAIPYRHRTDGRRPVLHLPRLLECSGDDAATRRLRAGLFARLRQAGPPVGPWAECFIDERDSLERTLKQAALPPLPWRREPAGRAAIDPALAGAPVGSKRSPAAGTTGDGGAGGAAEATGAPSAAHEVGAAYRGPRVDAYGRPDPLGMLTGDFDLAVLRAGTPEGPDAALDLLRDWEVDGAAARQGFLAFERMPGLLESPLGPAVRCMPALLRQGRVVWGRLVQANTALMARGQGDAPGAVVYSLDGQVPPEALAALAQTLMRYRGRSAELADPAVRALVDILDAEIEHVYGHTVPQSLAELAGLGDDEQPAPDLSAVRFSALWLIRGHLPGRRLLNPHLPLLLRDSDPGYVMVAPAASWPALLTAHWSQLDRAERRAEWAQEQARVAALKLPLGGSLGGAEGHAWGRGGQSGGQEDWEIVETRRNHEALTAYAQEGIALQRMRMLTQLGMAAFPPGTAPPPMEWEWALDEELCSRSHRLLTTLEGQQVRGAVGPALVRQIFAARASAQLIALHRRILLGRRRGNPTLQLIEADEIQYPVLAMLHGLEPWASRMGRLLLAMWRMPGHFAPMHPGLSALYRLVADHLRQPPTDLAPAPSHPALEALVSGQAWRGQPQHVARLMSAAFHEHQEQAPSGPFHGLPLPLLFMQHLRALEGLPPVPVEDGAATLRPIDARPQGLPANASLREALDTMADPLVLSVRARMVRMGFDDDEIEAAVLSGQPPRTRVALARPMPAGAQPQGR